MRLYTYPLVRKTAHTYTHTHIHTYTHTHIHTYAQSAGYSSRQAELIVTVSLTNHSLLREATAGATLGPSHTSMLLVGDATDSLLCKQRIR